MTTARQIIRSLSDDHASILADQRAALEDIRAQMAAHGDVPDGIDDLDFAQLLLDAGIIPADAIAYQEAIGVFIGDALVERGLVWRSVSDVEWGDLPAICHPTKNAVAYPMSSVVKRFARGEALFDVHHFTDEVFKALERMVAERDALDYDVADAPDEERARPAPRPFMNFIRGLTGKKPLN